jgi:aspartyl protease family protein
MGRRDRNESAMMSRAAGVFVLVFSFAIMAPELTESQQSYDRAAIDSVISSGCWKNAFACSAVEMEYRRRANLRDVDLRLKAYEKAATDFLVPPNILMAICERWEAEGIAREAECADERAAYLSAEDGTDFESIVASRLGKLYGQTVLRRARELGFEYWPELMVAPRRTQNGDAVTFQAAPDGQFYARAELDGVPINMLIDTGASAVLLTVPDAETIGIDLDALTYDVRIMTASGKEYYAGAEVRNLRLAGLHLRNVVVFVAKTPESLGVSLLGMSVLGSFSNI